MRKRINTLNASLMLNGISYGEHVMNADRVVEDVDAQVRGCANAFIVRCNPAKPMSDEMYEALARYAVSKNYHFGFYTRINFRRQEKRVI